MNRRPASRAFTTSIAVLASRILARGSAAAVPLALLATTAATQVACADENDPKTWVKRLDDPATRVTAAKRLSQFFDDAMTKANKNRDDDNVKKLLDDVVDPMTKTYTGGNLDEKSRKELMKTLADMRDPRTEPALTKAFQDYEPGKSDDGVKYAAQATAVLAKQGKITDPNLPDALWSCFSKHQPSKVHLAEVARAIHDAVVAVKAPTYGPKAVEKLGASVNLDDDASRTDQLDFWQTTSLQVISALKFEPAAKAVVKVVLSPEKGQLRTIANAALRGIAKAAEPVLIGAFNGTDSELAGMAKSMPDGAGPLVLADTLSDLSRPAGRDAILAALQKTNDDTQRTIFSQVLATNCPADPRSEDAVQGAYKKIAPQTRINAPNNPFARPVFVQVSASFFDPGVFDWAIKEVSGSKGDEAGSMETFGLEAVIKLMTKDKLPQVQALVSKTLSVQEQKGAFTGAAAVLSECDKDVQCYLKVLDKPDADSLRTIKAAWMVGIYGKDDARNALVQKLANAKDATSKLVMAEVIGHLTPKGDVATADAMDKIVAGHDPNDKSDSPIVTWSQRIRARTM